MRFRAGLVIGAAAGYYFGAKAGRVRYEQIESYLEQVRSSPAVRQLADRLVELADSASRPERYLDALDVPAAVPASPLGDPSLN
jgi:hypothetical protein